MSWKVGALNETQQGPTRSESLCLTRINRGAKAACHSDSLLSQKRSKEKQEIQTVKSLAFPAPTSLAPAFLAQTVPNREWFAFDFAADNTHTTHTKTNTNTNTNTQRHKHTNKKHTQHTTHTKHTHTQTWTDLGIRVPVRRRTQRRRHRGQTVAGTQGQRPSRHVECQDSVACSLRLSNPVSHTRSARTHCPHASANQHTMPAPFSNQHPTSHTTGTCSRNTGPWTAACAHERRRVSEARSLACCARQAVTLTRLPKRENAEVPRRTISDKAGRESK